MTNQSENSQDRDRKLGVDHDVLDKAALKKEFVDRIRKDSDGKDLNPTIDLPEQSRASQTPTRDS